MCRIFLTATKYNMKYNMTQFNVLFVIQNKIRPRYLDADRNEKKIKVR